eukprot:1767149-Amphidinium_carterae.1
MAGAAPRLLWFLKVFEATVRAAEEEKRIDPEVLPTLNHWLESKDAEMGIAAHGADSLERVSIVILARSSVQCDD